MKDIQAIDGGKFLFRQREFLGGMNYTAAPSRISAQEYRLLTNGRVRDNVVQPIGAPVALSAPSASRYQCVATIDSYLVFVADGYIYLQNCEDEVPSFNRIPDVRLNPGADTIYACPIPASNINYQRQSASSTGQVNVGVKFVSRTTASVAGVLLQDGSSQPVIVLPDGTARVTKNFQQWTPADPEYVPIGTMMLHDGIRLWIVGDKQCYRSVSGRPLDFMINIKDDGTRVSTNEEDDGAAFAATGATADAITALFALNNQEGELLVSTRRGGIILSEHPTLSLLGEPFYRVRPFYSGALTHTAIVDLNGDVAFVDIAGIKSFNATEATTQDSLLQELSYPVHALFTEQTTPSAARFASYAYFYANTTLGAGVLIYDLQLQKFVAFDNHPSLDGLKQFVVVDTLTQQKLFYITPTGLFAYGTGPASDTSINLGTITTEKIGEDLLPEVAYVLFERATATGTVTLTLTMDDGTVTTLTQNTTTTGNVPVVFSLLKSRRRASAINITLSWNFSANLQELQLVGATPKTTVPLMKS